MTEGLSTWRTKIPTYHRIAELYVPQPETPLAGTKTNPSQINTKKKKQVAKVSIGSSCIPCIMSPVFNVYITMAYLSKLRNSH